MKLVKEVLSGNQNSMFFMLNNPTISCVYHQINYMLLQRILKGASPKTIYFRDGTVLVEVKNWSSHLCHP